MEGIAVLEAEFDSGSCKVYRLALGQWTVTMNLYDRGYKHHTFTTFPEAEEYYTRLIKENFL